MTLVADVEEESQVLTWIVRASTCDAVSYVAPLLQQPTNLLHTHAGITNIVPIVEAMRVEGSRVFAPTLATGFQASRSAGSTLRPVLR